MGRDSNRTRHALGTGRERGRSGYGAGTGTDGNAIQGTGRDGTVLGMERDVNGTGKDGQAQDGIGTERERERDGIMGDGRKDFVRQKP